MDANGNSLGKSKNVAWTAIPQVIISRILMATPYMGKNLFNLLFLFSVLTPVIVNHLVKKPWFNSRRWISPVFQMLFCGVILLFSTPICCAIFPQLSEYEVIKSFDYFQIT